MALADLLKRITAEQETMSDQRMKAYRHLVGEIADEREPDVDRVATILSEAGMSVDALAADVEALIKRRELSQQAKRIPELDRKMQSLQKKIDTAVEAFRKIEEKHDQEVGKLADEYKSLSDARRSAEAARVRLIQTVTDEDLLAKKAELAAAFTAKHNEIAEARNLLDVRQRRLIESRDLRDKKSREDEEAKWTKRIAESKALIPALEKELEAIQAEQAELNQLLLEP